MVTKGRKRAATKAKPSGKRRTATSKPPAKANWKVALDSARSVKERKAALLSLSRTIAEDPNAMPGVLKMIGAADLPIPLRLTALQVVQAASFSVVTFNRWRPSYLTALRAASEDENPELRQRVLGMLAREKDGKTQQRLLEGLTNPAKALVPPEKALQLLSYDVHAEAYPIAREIVRNPPNPVAKREALRLLAADAASVPLFEGMLRDKTQPTDIRQLSASALHALAPQTLQSNARQLLLDETENDDVRAASLTALTTFGQQEGVGQDEAVHREVDRLSGASTSVHLKQSARHFLKKYRR